MKVKNKNISNYNRAISNATILELPFVYFIGIGGIGMSAIARYFYENKKQVAGYDKSSTKITGSLEKLGIKIHYEDAVGNIPSSFLEKEKTLVVYTPAISKNMEFRYFSENNYTVLKRAEILGKITENTYCLAVAGTHGKTTVSSILGHIMKQVNATSFLGGITENYNSNLIFGGNKISVVEADEFDGSFLKLKPNIACITSIDEDHLDYYKNSAALKESYIEFSKKVSRTLVVAKGVPIKGITYSASEEADYMALNLKFDKDKYVFDLQTPLKFIKNIELSLLGVHNVENALAAIALADIYGIYLENIKQSLSTFKGLKRRFSFKIKTNNFVLIDDYAHHPTEIKVLENSLRKMFPDDKILAVFQPHLYSRTRDFVDDFALALGKFDEVLLLDIYPAREEPIPNVSSKILLDKIKLKNKKLVQKSSLIINIKSSTAKVVAVFGAGDIDQTVDNITSKLLKSYK